MSLIVTPGAANADAMADVDAFDAYCIARGVTNDFMVAAKEAALRVGAQYATSGSFVIKSEAGKASATHAH